MRTVLVAVVAFTICSVPAFARQETAVLVYAKQLNDLSVQYSSFVKRVAQVDRSNAAQVRGLMDEQLALLQLVHRLSEAAAKSSIDAPAASEVRLLLISQASEAISFTLGSAANYLTTGDRIFLALLREGDALVNATRKGL